MRAPRMVVMAVALGGLLAGTAQADRVYLTNGYSLSGEVTEQGDTVIVRTRSGRIFLRRFQVEKVERIETARQRFVRVRREIRRSAPGDLDALVKLAVWAQQAGLDAQAEAELRAVLDVDAGHPGARKALGYVRHAGAWVTRDQKMRLLGLVKSDGEWVSPDEARLKAEAERAARTEQAEARLTEARIQAAQAETLRAEAEAERARAEADRAQEEAADLRYRTVLLHGGYSSAYYGGAYYGGAYYGGTYQSGVRRGHVLRRLAPRPVDAHTRQRNGWRDPNNPHTRQRLKRDDPCDPHNRLKARPLAAGPTSRAAGLLAAGSLHHAAGTQPQPLLRVRIGGSRAHDDCDDHHSGR